MIKGTLKKMFILTIIVFFILLLMFIVYFFYLEKKTSSIKDTKSIDSMELLKEEESKSLTIVNKCLTSVPTDIEIDNRLNELKTYITSTYPNTSVLYYDINSKLTFKYNEEEVYYGASLIKVLSSLYIYEKALINPSILEDEVTYLSKYRVPHSLELSKHTIGDKIKVRDLVKYAIEVSDNSSHFMLIDYIGFDILKEFGNTVGNKYTLTGGDQYGDIDLNGAFSYMYRLNEYINNNLELGKELRSYFDNDYFNSLELENTNFLHKYGNFEASFHDIGISESDNPYIIVVLTSYGYNNKEKTINDISKQIYDFHSYYINKKLEICNK